MGPKMAKLLKRLYSLLFWKSNSSLDNTNFFVIKNAIQVTVQTQHMWLYKYEIVSIKYLYKR